ncbi:nucleotide exchange factor GrpE [Clostridium sp. BJN0001]|uniref:nucleotide exchange factor GrpE n=1 Tax=Clostridium sp. BJN0001 TaxID=2930219 RepID=UPI001FD36F1A|nr:nucleotide exchange factor GrpE [Clostridium sp. BJN0001]
MSNENDNKNKNEEVKIEDNAENVEETKAESKDEASENKEQGSDELSMTKKYKEEAEKIKIELDNTKDKLLRTMAEYDNFRKRTVKEKEGIYADAYSDVLKEILPVIDNLERAAQAEGSVDDLKKGIEMTLKGCTDAFNKLGVEEIDASGEFDPNYHNAVMHIEDENLGKNVIAEVLQKGYKKDDKVIRYSMVKVAN